jgi:hypothetical protein
MADLRGGAAEKRTKDEGVIAEDGEDLRVAGNRLTSTDEQVSDVGGLAERVGGAWLRWQTLSERKVGGGGDWSTKEKGCKWWHFYL